MKEKIKPISMGEFRAGKTKDCAVRALSNVTLFDYEECEELLALHGRKLNKGTYDATLIAAYEAAGLNNVQVFGESRRVKGFTSRLTHRFNLPVTHRKGTTLKNFIENNPKGRFLVLYSGHATSVIDGQLVDTFANNPNKRVIAAFSK